MSVLYWTHIDIGFVPRTPHRNSPIYCSSRNIDLLLTSLFILFIHSLYYSERSRDGERLGRMVLVPNSLHKQRRPLLV